MKNSANWKNTILFQVALQFVIILLVVVQGLGLGWLSYRAEPEMTVKTIPHSSISVKDRVSISSRDYTISRNGLCKTEDRFGTPLLYIDFSKVPATIQTIAFSLSNYESIGYNSHFGADHLKCKLLVSDIYGEHTERDYNVEYIQEDGRMVIFKVPLDEYDVIAFSSNSTFQIDDIYISPEAPVEKSVKRAFDLTFCIFPCLVLFLVYESLVIFKAYFVPRLRWAFQALPRIALFIALELIGITLFCFIGGILFRFLWKQEYFFYRKAFFGAIGAMIPALCFAWKTLAQRPERTFVVLALCVGVLLILVLPVTSYVTWDDQIHYRTSMSLSSGQSAAFTAADDEVAGMRYLGTMTYQDHNISAVHNEYLNQAHSKGTIYYGISETKLNDISYFPQALGLWIGRLMRLPFTGVFFFGRFMNLLMYVLVVYVAMRRLKYGKMLLAVIALVPISVYQASNYTYDSWVIMFILLGTALYLGEIQRPETPMTIGKELGIIAVFLLGILPKAVYFPIVWMLLIMPKEKFTSARHRRMYYAILLIGIILSVMLLAFTVFQDTGIITDSRGGGDVDGGRQIQNILQDPVKYAVFLLRYLFVEYFNPLYSDTVLNYVGYFTEAHASFDGYLWNLATLLFVTMTSFGRHENESLTRGTDAAVHVGMAVSVLAATALVATSMYIAFTPVGYETGTIAGVQGRYFTPLLFAGLAAIRTKRIQQSFPPRLYNGIVYLVLAIILYNGVWKVLAQMQ